jgi:uncharacterized coiled-coil protein SlyX
MSNPEKRIEELEAELADRDALIAYLRAHNEDLVNLLVQRLVKEQRSMALRAEMEKAFMEATDE